VQGRASVFPNPVPNVRATRERVTNYTQSEVSQATRTTYARFSPNPEKTTRTPASAAECKENQQMKKSLVLTLVALVVVSMFAVGCRREEPVTDTAITDTSMTMSETTDTYATDTYITDTMATDTMATDMTTTDMTTTDTVMTGTTATTNT
jgi:hypothetical protein